MEFSGVWGGAGFEEAVVIQIYISTKIHSLLTQKDNFLLGLNKIDSEDTTATI